MLPRVNADEVRERLTRRPDQSALLFDFDGTLAPIVDHPEAAAPIAGSVELLDRLAQRFRRVAVVSGRPAAFLDPLIPRSVHLSALYGLEFRLDGVIVHHEDADRWRPVVDDVVRTSSGLPATVVLEHKGLSLTAHFRTDPAAEPQVRAWAESVAAATGLVPREAKASIELHPPIDADKGTATLTLAEGCATVAFVGDDLGDLPAFQALDALRDEGVDIIKVASGGRELPGEIAAAADLVVDGPEAVVDLFGPLV